MKKPSLRVNTFFGVWYLGAAAALGGNDTPLYWTGHPMSNRAQTIFLMIMLSVAGYFLSSAAVQLQKVR